MNDPTRPPLYAYQEAYKSIAPASFDGRVRRTQRFTDEEYNDIVRLMGNVSPAKDSHYINVKSNDPRKLRQLFRDTGIITPAVMTVNLASGNILIQYSLNDAGKLQRMKDLSKLLQIKKGGPIIEYDPTNPLIAYNSKGKVVNLTQALNYSNSMYHDEDIGNSRILSKDVAKKAQELTEQNIAAQKTSSMFNYVLIGVVAITVIVLIWTVKKNK